MPLVPFHEAGWYRAAYATAAVTPTTAAAPPGLFAGYLFPATLFGRPEHECLFLANRSSAPRAGVRVFVGLVATDDVTGLPIPGMELAVGVDPTDAFDFTVATSPTRAAVPPPVPTPNPPTGSPPWVTPRTRLHMPPPGVTFAAPTTAAAGLEVGDLGAYQARAVWLRRTVPPGGDQRAYVRAAVSAWWAAP